MSKMLGICEIGNIYRRFVSAARSTMRMRHTKHSGRSIVACVSSLMKADG